MKKKIFYIFIILIISCCQTTSEVKIDKNKAYAYTTAEFEKWESSKKIKLKEAFKIHYKYLVEINKSSKKK